MRQLLPILAITAASFALPAFADDAPQLSTLSVSGHGEVVASPDTATVNAGVTTQAATAREALTANTTAMTALLAALKTAGIASTDIQTSGFSVNPQMVYPAPAADGTQTPPHITGYQVQNGVTVKISKLADLGTILDRVVTVGGNTINGVTFSVADTGKLLDEARKAAFADAESKAKTYADAAGVGLGRVLSISESSGGNAPGPVMFKAMAAPAAAPVPVEAGQLTFDTDVAVQWELKTAAN